MQLQILNSHPCILNSISAAWITKPKAPMFLLDFMLFAVIAVLVQIKLASAAVEGNIDGWNREVHWLMGLAWSSFISE